METEGAWELFRRGQLDQERHHQLVRDAVKKHLPDLIAHSDITGGGRVRIPVREIREYRFMFDPEQTDRTGTFQPGDGPGQPGGGQPGGRPKKGTILGRRGQQQGQGGAGGDGQGDGHYEVEIGVEQVADVVFADLELPRIRPRVAAQAYKETQVMRDVRKRGAMSNLDKKRTVIENIRRNAAAGEAKFGGLADDDLRFRAVDVERHPQDQVAVLFVRDRSGSMGEDEKLFSRSLAFWITRFLQFKYRQVASAAYVLFDTQAAEVDEDTFFHQSEGGGTRISAGVGLAGQIIAERFPPARYNLYVFIFSDGDNDPGDYEPTVELIQALLPDLNLLGYADVRAVSEYHGRNLAHDLEAIGAANLVTVGVRSPADVQAAMQRLFKRQPDSGRG